MWGSVASPSGQLGEPKLATRWRHLRRPPFAARHWQPPAALMTSMYGCASRVGWYAITGAMLTQLNAPSPLISHLGRQARRRSLRIPRSIRNYLKALVVNFRRREKEIDPGLEVTWHNFAMPCTSSVDLNCTRICIKCTRNASILKLNHTSAQFSSFHLKVAMITRAYVH
jgi:hypothetical protein